MIEHIQERALAIAFPSTEYENALILAGIPSLEDRRTKICQKLFNDMKVPDHKLFKMLPPKMENTHNIRDSKEYPTPTIRTNRFKNTFLPYALFNLQ